MKRILLASIFLGILLQSCTKEEPFADSIIDFSTPYEMKDLSDNSVDKRVKEIYSKYKVAVFFNDTVSKKFSHINAKGDSVYIYERIDMNWNFNSYEAGIKYEYEYLITDEQKNNALDFVEVFLSKMSEKMLPFSLLLTEKVTVTKRKDVENPSYKNNYRSMVIAELGGESTPTEVEERSAEMMLSITLDRVLINSKVVAEFGAVSDKRYFYGKTWLGDSKKPSDENLGIDLSGLREKYKEFELIPYKFENGKWVPDPSRARTTWPFYYNPMKMFDEGYYEKVVKKQTAEYNRTEEEFNEIRETLISKIGQVGFIGGWKNSNTTHGPEDVKEDLEQYIRVLLPLGKDKFIERYGSSPLVMEKLNILTDYVEGELGVKL